MDLDALKAQLTRHEGLRLKPYRDTLGHLTIGVGRNLSEVGISEAEAIALLDADIQRRYAASTCGCRGGRRWTTCGGWRW